MSSLQRAMAKEKTAIGGSSLQKAVAKEKSERGGGKHPPPVTTAYESSSEDDDSSVENEQQRESVDMIKIRQKALKVLNTPSSGPHAEALKTKHGQKSFASPYQQQSASSASPVYSSYQSASPYAMHDPRSHPQARSAEPLSLTDMVVNCVSDVCKSSSSEIFHKVMSAGYKSVSQYESPPVNGTWGEIDTSQHGYGNGNKTPAFAQRSGSASGNGGGNMPSRYQD